VEELPEMVSNISSKKKINYSTWHNKSHTAITIDFLVKVQRVKSIRLKGRDQGERRGVFSTVENYLKALSHEFGEIRAVCS